MSLGHCRKLARVGPDRELSGEEIDPIALQFGPAYKGGTKVPKELRADHNEQWHPNSNLLKIGK